MKKYAILFVSFLLISVSVRAQEVNANTSDLTTAVPDGVTVQTVLENYINAIGGVEKLKAVKSVMTNYEGDSPMGVIGQVEKRVSDKYAQITSVNGNVMASVVATSTEMFMRQGGNKIPLPSDFVEDTKGIIGTFFELTILNDPKIKLSGIEKVDGKDAYKVELPGVTMSATFYYDVESGLKIKDTSIINMGGQTQTSESRYSDYQETDGILFASKKSSTMGPQEIEMVLKEVLIDSGVTDADFE